MSRKLFAFLLSELVTARIICKMCGGISELPIERLEFIYPPECPQCKKAINFSAANQNAFLNLIRAHREIRTHAQIDIEFVLPDNGDKATPATTPK